MAPCTTTGTTWETCGHSIYQHQPSCKHRGNRCTKNSLLQPGICPSCTQIDYYPTSQPPRLPDHLSRSDTMTPTKIKKEPVDENDNMGLVKKEVMHPDEYLKSEYEKHKKELAEKAGNAGTGNSGAGSGLFGKEEKMGENIGGGGGGLFDPIIKRNLNGSRGGGAFSGASKNEQQGKNLLERNIKGNMARGEGNRAFGGAVKDDQHGKEYFLEFHIKQLEEKLEAARLREVENNVQIRNLQAQVGLLCDPPAERSYAASGSTRDTSSVSIKCGPAEGPVATNTTQGGAESTPLSLQPGPVKPFIDVREQIHANRGPVNNGYQAGGAQLQVQVQGGAPVNQGERGRQLQQRDQLHMQSPRSQGARVKQWQKIPPLKEEVVSTLANGGDMVSKQINAEPIQVFWTQVGEVDDIYTDESHRGQLRGGQQALKGQLLQVGVNALQAVSQVQQNRVQVNVHPQLNSQPHLNTTPAPNNESHANEQQLVIHAPATNQKQLFDIAGISFASQLVVKIITLKDAINIDALDYWFDGQVVDTFKCAQELNFGKMVAHYKDFVDFIGAELAKAHREKMQEEKVLTALKECEIMVQILMDAEAIIAAST